ncbi:expressed unknown protein [Seminavis robusta]|uniref:Uncharacterized protein n=1 Tax=Seminavis robusta TaxID=568900 RepID=A0A9N8HNZ7_9STRA|nr:expressed unknown protein [Seminavis robusta]|eukprot:Sro1025_g232810.1 n/a (230) ;mRNA; f:25790-26479
MTGAAASSGHGRPLVSMVVWSILFFVLPFCDQVMGLQNIKITKPTQYRGRRTMEPMKPLDAIALSDTPSTTEDDPILLPPSSSKRSNRTGRGAGGDTACIAEPPTTNDVPAEQINLKTEQPFVTPIKLSRKQLVRPRALLKTRRKKYEIMEYQVGSSGDVALVHPQLLATNNVQKMLKQAVYRFAKAFAAYLVFALVCEDVTGFMRTDPFNMLVFLCLWTATSTAGSSE